VLEFLGGKEAVWRKLTRPVYLHSLALNWRGTGGRLGEGDGLSITPPEHQLDQKKTNTSRGEGSVGGGGGEPQRALKKKNVVRASVY